jgi:hypothetical protein
MASKTLYKVTFMNQGQVYEVYARSVGHGALFGFVEMEELVFGERSSVVLDPSEEKIKSEFKGVKRTYLPMHSIITSPSFRCRYIRREAKPTARVIGVGVRALTRASRPCMIPVIQEPRPENTQFVHARDRPAGRNRQHYFGVTGPVRAIVIPAQ